MWIWANLEPEKLPESLIRAFESDATTAALSVVSIWETMVAMEKGRVTTTASPETTVRSWLAANPFQVIPLDAEIALLSRTLPFEHEDPADRFIGATAFRHGFRLATADDRLRRLSWLSLLS